MKDVLATWGPVTAAGNSPIISTQTGEHYPIDTEAAAFHTIQAFVNGTATACQFHVYGSTKNVSRDNPVYPADFQDLTGAIDGTSTMLAHIAYKPVASIVIVLSSFTGATNVTFKYIGKRSA